MNLIHEQAVTAGRIFLNVFGFTLEDGEIYTKGDSLKIFDKNKKIVGNLNLDKLHEVYKDWRGEVHYICEDEKVFINVNHNGNILKASYVVPNPSSIITPDTNYENGDWASNISFEFIDSDNHKMEGRINIDCIFNSYGELNSVCHSEFKFMNKDNREVNIKIHNLCFIDITIDGDNYSEKIAIEDTYSSYNGYKVIHQVNEKGISKVVKVTEYDNDNNYKLLMVYDIYKDNSGEKVVPKIGIKIKKRYEDYEEATEMEDLELIKVQGEDQEMFNRINELFDYIKCDGVSILNNVVNITFDDYSDEWVKYLFGIDRDRTIYQDGASNLTDACFGVKTENLDKPRSYFKIGERE